MDLRDTIIPEPMDRKHWVHAKDTTYQYNLTKPGVSSADWHFSKYELLARPNLIIEAAESKNRSINPILIIYKKLDLQPPYDKFELHIPIHISIKK